jgi:hypothetical protein
LNQFTFDMINRNETFDLTMYALIVIGNVQPENIESCITIDLILTILSNIMFVVMLSIMLDSCSISVYLLQSYL